MDTDDTTFPCADKLAFDTQKQAKAVTATSAYQRGLTPKLKVYRCKHCGLWHLATDYDSQ